LPSASNASAICARRQQEQGPDRRVQCRALPMVRHRAPRACKEGSGAFDDTRHVDGTGHLHALSRSSGNPYNYQAGSVWPHENRAAEGCFRFDLAAKRTRGRGRWLERWSGEPTWT
jgi:hypothetical protein